MARVYRSIRAFEEAHAILAVLHENGIDATVQMFHDGSGALFLHRQTIPRGLDGLVEWVEKQLKSNCWVYDRDGDRMLAFCCGWTS